MKRFLFASLFLSAVLLSACASVRSEDAVTSTYESYGEEFYAPSADEAMALKSESSGASDFSIAAEDRKIIKTGQLSLHVDSVQDAVLLITQMIEEAEGNVDSSSIVRGDNSYTANMSLRVPSEEFDQIMLMLKQQAVYVDSEDTNASDVTEYYTDLGTRLTNKQAEETQYLELLKQTGTMADTLAVTQALSNVRYEIESLQGQLKYYDGQIDYSTISVYLTEDESVSAVSETWKPVSTVREALSNWVVFLQDLVDTGIYLLIFGWPFLILAYFLRIWFKKKSKPSKK